MFYSKICRKLSAFYTNIFLFHTRRYESTGLLPIMTFYNPSLYKKKASGTISHAFYVCPLFQIFTDHLPDTAVFKSKFPLCYACKFVFRNEFYLFRNRLCILNPYFITGTVFFIRSSILPNTAVPYSLCLIFFITFCA